MRSSEKSKAGGLTEAGRRKAAREGHHLGKPVTESRPTGRQKARRKSFCARFKGMRGAMRKNGKPTRKALAMRRWKCRG